MNNIHSVHGNNAQHNWCFGSRPWALDNCQRKTIQRIVHKTRTIGQVDKRETTWTQSITIRVLGKLYTSIYLSYLSICIYIYIYIHIYYQRSPRIHIVSPGTTDSQLTQQTSTNVALGDDPNAFPTWFLWVDHPKPFGPFGPSARSLNFLLFFFSNCSSHRTGAPGAPGSKRIFALVRAPLVQGKIYGYSSHMFICGFPLHVTFNHFWSPLDPGGLWLEEQTSPCPSCTIPADLQQSLSNVSYGLLTQFYRLENWKHPTSTSISSPFLLRQFILLL